jgi:hypothetical protein
MQGQKIYAPMNIERGERHHNWMERYKYPLDCPGLKDYQDFSVE